MSYFYKNIDSLELIIFFGRRADSDELNQHIFGCVIESQSEILICDTTCMTACRKPRELEIIEIFRHMIANGFLDFMYFNPNKLLPLKSMSITNSYKLICDES